MDMNMDIDAILETFRKSNVGAAESMQSPMLDVNSVGAPEQYTLNNRDIDEILDAIHKPNVAAAEPMQLTISKVNSIGAQAQYKFKICLVNEVRKRSIIFDPKHKKFLVSSAKEETWQRIANRLHTDVDMCRNTWIDLRYNYQKYARRLRKFMSSGNKNRKRRPMMMLETQMLFLWPYIFDEHHCALPYDKDDKKITEPEVATVPVPPIEDDDIMLVEDDPIVINLDDEEDNNPKTVRGPLKVSKEMRSLVAIIKDYSELYDPNNCYYGDYKRRGIIWNAIANEMSDKATKLMKMWIYMQSRYECEIQAQIKPNSPSELMKLMSFLRMYILNNPYTVYKQSYFLKKEWIEPIDNFRNTTSLLAVIKKNVHIINLTEERLTKCIYEEAYFTLWNGIARLRGSSAAQCEVTWLIMRSFYWELMHMRNHSYQLQDKWYFEATITDLYTCAAKLLIKRSEAIGQPSLPPIMPPQVMVQIAPSSLRTPPSTATTAPAPAPAPASASASVSVSAPFSVSASLHTVQSVYMPAPLPATLPLHAPLPALLPTPLSTPITAILPPVLPTPLPAGISIPLRRIQATSPPALASLSSVAPSAAPSAATTGKLLAAALANPSAIISAKPSGAALAKPAAILPKPLAASSVATSAKLSAATLLKPSGAALAKPLAATPAAPSASTSAAASAATSTVISAKLLAPTLVSLSAAASAAALAAPSTVPSAATSTASSAATSAKPAAATLAISSVAPSATPSATPSAAPSADLSALSTSNTTIVIDEEDIQTSITCNDPMPKMRHATVKRPRSTSGKMYQISPVLQMQLTPMTPAVLPEYKIEVIPTLNGIKISVTATNRGDVNLLVQQDKAEQFLREIMCMPLLHNRYSTNYAKIDGYWKRLAQRFQMPVVMCKAIWRHLQDKFDHLQLLVPLEVFMVPSKNEINVWKSTYQMFNAFDTNAVKKGWLKYRKLLPRIMTEIEKHPCMYDDLVTYNGQRTFRADREEVVKAAWGEINAKFKLDSSVDWAEIWTAFKNIFYRYIADLEHCSDNKWPRNWWRVLVKLSYLIEYRHKEIGPLYYILRNKINEEIMANTTRDVGPQAASNEVVQNAVEALPSSAAVTSPLQEVPSFTSRHILCSEIDEYALMTSILRHPKIYEKCDSESKQNAWTSVAEEMKASVLACQLLFQNTVRNYRRLLITDSSGRCRINQSHYKPMSEIFRAVRPSKKLNIRTPTELNQLVGVDGSPSTMMAAGHDDVFPERFIAEITMSNSNTSLVMKNWAFAIGNLTSSAQTQMENQLSALFKKYCENTSS